MDSTGRDSQKRLIEKCRVGFLRDMSKLIHDELDNEASGECGVFLEPTNKEMSLWLVGCQEPMIYGSE